MKVAVITPYYKESIEIVERCHKSVLSQTHSVTHILVADGFPNDVVQAWNTQHIILPVSHGDYGDTPRLIGSLSAVAQGFDAICFLDADCWFESGHIESLVSLMQKEKVDIVTATRVLRRSDGSVLGICAESNGTDFNDTNCYLISKKAYGVLPFWTLKDKKFSIIGDRIFWSEILKKGYSKVHSKKPTVNYTTLFAHHYILQGEEPPLDSKIITSVLDNGVYKSYVYNDVKDDLDKLMKKLED
ncbi:MAG: hypothetical protein RJA61_607 [Candidatus Parcubacteria bacterium]|jgi:glycosyltransferase involved in cell wall biosynthesis